MKVDCNLDKTEVNSSGLPIYSRVLDDAFPCPEPLPKCVKTGAIRVARDTIRLHGGLSRLSARLSGGGAAQPVPKPVHHSRHPGSRTSCITEARNSGHTKISATTFTSSVANANYRATTIHKLNNGRKEA
jgi:hypothetical protein